MPNISDVEYGELLAERESNKALRWLPLVGVLLGVAALVLSQKHMKHTKAIHDALLNNNQPNGAATQTA